MLRHASVKTEFSMNEALNWYVWKEIVEEALKGEAADRVGRDYYAHGAPRHVSGGPGGMARCSDRGALA